MDREFDFNTLIDELKEKEKSSTLRESASRIGLDFTTLNRTMNGKMPLFSNLIKIVDYLGYELVLRKKR